MDRKPHVAVIGAGLAGLRCADLLIQNGAQVTIFEARDRMGGRIVQEKIGDHLVDLGANWIHCTRTNPIIELAELTKTHLEDWDGVQATLGPNGKLIDEQTDDKISKFVWGTINDAFAYSEKYGDSIPPERSLLDYFCEKVEETSFTAAEKALCMESCKLWGTYMGEPVWRQSLKFFKLEQCIDGTNLFVTATFKAILDAVARTAKQHADIHLSEPVTRIDAQPRQSLTSRSPITVTTSANKTYNFDEIIVTSPLGWLKQNKAVFSPALTPRLSAAIDNISYGRLEKVYVTFPRAWWHSEKTKFQAIANGYPPFTQFLEPDPKYVSGIVRPDNIPWNQECLSLAALGKDFAHPTLLFYTYGDCGSYILSQIKDLPKHSQQYNTFLDAFVRPFYSLLPQFSASDPDCVPTAFLATEWQNDPWAGNGSYCNFQVGVQEADKDIEIMREGMGKERGVWFAGEHTSPFEGLGTTTGAYWSGNRVAGQVCDALGLSGKGVGAGQAVPRVSHL
ncbi:hypothetical protein N7510_003276 [Penicillium lagena]|uniref:uncharacterized protein n=1 Tax=Penicillium lagena TaxID=94218 RepID=UPI002540BF0F|nr:uncharacterized protein N7510_003276 [Penicillium lagena]KAJ5619292.1 hypothetical protein N7510_003276 [Penicillium lagena]